MPLRIFRFLCLKLWSIQFESNVKKVEKNMSEVLGKSAAQSRKNNTNLEDTPLEPTPDIKKLWSIIHTEMRKEFGEAIFRSWLKPLILRAYYHGTMEVSVPTRFMRDWIQTHYAERISSMCTEKNPDVKRVQIVVVQNAILDGRASCS